MSPTTTIARRVLTPRSMVLMHIEHLREGGGGEDLHVVRVPRRNFGRRENNMYCVVLEAMTCSCSCFTLL